MLAVVADLQEIKTMSTDKLNWYFDQSVLESHDPIFAQGLAVEYKRETRRQSRRELRAISLAKETMPMHESLIKIGRDMLATVMSGAVLLFTPLKNKNSMCKYYGHVINRSWSGHAPSCNDCGATVTDSSMLRKANTPHAA